MTLSKPRTAAVFVDRDGVLIRDVSYLFHAGQLEILPGVPEAICLLRATGLKVIVVTNQSVIARGWLTEDQLAAIHEELRRRLARSGAFLDAIYYCPHHPTEGLGSYRVACSCRKPNPGMIERASLELAVDPSISYLVGDQWRDMELAFRVRAKGIWIRRDGSSDKKSSLGVRIAEDLWHSARWIREDFDHQASARSG
jgi:D-glycero-D-manno-heptose 1,7-bisphosphate phosphatase